MSLTRCPERGEEGKKRKNVTLKTKISSFPPLTASHVVLALVPPSNDRVEVVLAPSPRNEDLAAYDILRSRLERNTDDGMTLASLSNDQAVQQIAHEVRAVCVYTLEDA